MKINYSSSKTKSKKREENHLLINKNWLNYHKFSAKTQRKLKIKSRPSSNSFKIKEERAWLMKEK